MKRLLAAFAFAISLVGVAPLAAQDAAAPNPLETAEAKSTLTIANALITYGRANQDPLALLSGVQMMVKAAAGTTIESAGKPMDLGAVLDEAVAMAPDDALIVARADVLRDEAETKTRGVCYWEYWCDYYGYCEYWYVCY
ncbi:hypothetical protein EI545_16335 [Tabrizicola piscis]|uniref:Uncharacterized protein n=1 Tax=Tabrizicola piscis TaxID=2494374 RepID=A0A3S8U963_9RHOB|nr:hypothetical protein [Tabrizicola piscis]AZL60252.1 hypothetical protein EI545_16335 [Tabrizicola piscis]